MTITMNAAIKTALAVVVVAVSAAPATAETRTTQIHARMAFNPEEPAELIYARLAAQARAACERGDSGKPSRFDRDERACAADLLDKAVRQINRADLLALAGAEPVPATAG
jgi:UrcA family protein